MFSDLLTTATESSGGLALIKQIAHNQLVVLNDRGAWVLRVAAEQLSTERGSWRVNPDGTMDTIWKLRPNTKWQDGTLFTSEDLLFSFTVYKDREIPNKIGAPLQLMESATAPDPLTFIVHWSAPYPLADQAPGLEALAKHLLEGVYLTDKAQFTNSSLFRSDFVGLGAYRLMTWEPGSHMEFTPFDDYYLGRPPLGRVVVRIIPNVNTIAANLLAGALDVVTEIDLGMATGLEFRDRWQGTGNQVSFVPSDKPLWIEIQHRPEFARPVNGLINRTVRQAFLYGLDRELLVELLSAEQVADSWIHPNHELRSQLAGAIPQYPHNPARAQQLLAEAGWTRGPDGILVHQTSRDMFRLEARFAPEDEKIVTVAADNWKALGVDVSLFEVTPALKSDNEFRAKFSGVVGASRPSIPLARTIHSRFMASPENRWTGYFNGYSNPKVDALVERFDATIDPGARLALHRELLQEILEDVALMPTVWDLRPVLAVKGVTGIKGRTAWNVHEWTKQ